MSGASDDHSPLTAPTILVVEDDPNLQFLIAEQIEHIPARAVIHPSGPEALAWLATHSADVVVLDLMLPGMDGYEVCRRIRQKFPPTALPILMLSALGEDVEARIKGIQAGANDFMPKPYNLQEFLARARMLLSIKAETRKTESLLARYTSRVMREQAQLDPDWLGAREQREATVMFADLRGFTHLSASVRAEALMGVLDEFFDSMMRIVDEHGGTVFDLIGDEFLAGFNVPVVTPDSTLHAVNAARAMGKRFQDLQKRWREAGYEVGIGVGLHRGEVTLGNVGSASLTRYTVMGNVVNIAHRLVEMAEDGQLIVSSAVIDALKPPPADLRAVPVGEVALKGLDAPQTVHRVTLYE